MKTILSSIFGALLAVAFCLVAIRIVDWVGTMPHFPVYAGESDFGLRAAWFLLAVVPGFLLMGGWLGVVFARSWKAGLYAVVGGLIGSVCYFVALYLLRYVIESVPNDSAANAGAIIALLSWVVLTALGAQLGRALARR